jgi:two-component sensor histidine kinase
MISIARQTKDSSLSLEQYVELLERRIGALSLAHDLVGGSGHQWAKVEELLGSELRPYDMNSNRISTDGPPLAVRADVAPILSLLFHEMTSNAVKYGALSEKGVSLSVQWFEDAGGISILWNETLIEEVRQPESQGFGLALIKRSLPYECNGSSEVTFSGKEFKIKFWLPADSVTDATGIEFSSKPKTQVKPTSEFGLDRVDSALVVEDNMVLAMELERMLAEMGVNDVQALPNSSFAFDAMAHQKFDCAILDINLGNEDSFELGIALLAAGVPIVLASGYDNRLEVPSELANVPRVVKPIGRLDIAAAITKAIDDMHGAAE